MLKAPAMNRALALALVVVSSFTFVACDDSTGGVGQQDSDVDAGESCQWSGPGNAKYKEAVAAAKAWGKHECEVVQTEVLTLAQDAVDLCPAVGALIAESQWAGGLRDALGPLEVAYLAGDLDGEGDALNVDAVAEALVGQTLWAPGQGAYGSHRILHLGEGTYELERLILEEDGETIARPVTGRGTWGAATSDDGSIVVSFTATETRDADDELAPMSFERWTGWEELEVFRLVPADGSVDEYSTNALFAVNLSECDA